MRSQARWSLVFALLTALAAVSACAPEAGLRPDPGSLRNRDRPPAGGEPGLSILFSEDEGHTPAWLDEDLTPGVFPSLPADFAGGGGLRGGTLVFVPAIRQFGDGGLSQCDAIISAQNIGGEPTKVIAVFFGPSSGACPPSAPGPIGISCSGFLVPGAAWVFAGSQVPSQAQSAVLFSVHPSVVDDLCTAVGLTLPGGADNYRRLLHAFRNGEEVVLRGGGPPSDVVADGEIDDRDFGEDFRFDLAGAEGAPIGAVLNRSCATGTAVGANAAAEGISDAMINHFDYAPPLVTYAFPVFADRAETNTTLHIGNAGEECTSVDVYFREQGDCIRARVVSVLNLAPGESRTLSSRSGVGPDWQGSATIRSSQPLAVFVDTLGPADVFTSHRGVTAEDAGVSLHGALALDPDAGFSSTVAVFNLDSAVQAQTKVTHFNESGDILDTAVAEVCPEGVQLVAFSPDTSLFRMAPGRTGWVTVDSQPNDGAEARYIASVLLSVRGENLDGFAPSSGGAYNLATAAAWALAMPVATLQWAPFELTSAFSITNVGDLEPARFTLYLFDQNGPLDFVEQSLAAGHVDYADLATYFILSPGFLGSSWVSQDGGPKPLLAGAVAEWVAHDLLGDDPSGDELKLYEAFPTDFAYVDEDW